MKKTKTRLKGGPGKWLGYSGMATTFLAVTPSAKAQVVSVDVDPDVVVDGSTYDVDFDGDGTADVQITQSQTSSSSYGAQVIGVNVPAGNAVLGSTSSPYMYPNVLASGDPIAPGDPNFQTESFGSLNYGGFAGNWSDTTGFLGCRFVGGDGMDHYGWVQLSVPANSDSVTVMAYGYEASPETAIDAGDMATTVGIADKGAPAPWGVVANPVSDRAIINLPHGTDEPMTLTLLGATGQVLFTDEVQGMDRYSLPMADRAAGVYFLRVQQGKRVGFRKIAKQ
jgi:hypothetical protein